MNDIVEYISSLDKQKINSFFNQTNSDILVKREIEQKISDTKWIDFIEDAIPYLDNIIRNPRKFIIQEENIIPIEKAKIVTEESIKHLAQNTNLIQEVKEDGSIIPLKILNVYREETMDLYENRFIKSLVDNLYQFVENKLSESDQKSYAKVNNEVHFNGAHYSKNETVKVSLSLESSFTEEMAKYNNGYSIEERIEYIRDVIGNFKNSTFIKSLHGSSPVRSPIRKTNVILKDQNFIKAVELWEFLEANNIRPVTKIEKINEEVKDESIKKLYDLALYIEKDALKIKKEQENVVSDTYISKIINDFVFGNDITENALMRLISREFKDAYNRKIKINNKIRQTIKTFVKENERRKKKAEALLR